MNTKKLKIIILIAILTVNLGILTNINQVQAASKIEIRKVEIKPTTFLQGSQFQIETKFRSRTSINYATFVFVVTNQEDEAVSYIETDFYDISPGTHSKTFSFKWTGFKSARTGELTLSSASIKQYESSMEESHVVTTKNISAEIKVEKVKDPILKQYLSRENSLWWLTKMSWADSSKARKNKLDYCIMYGGYTEGQITAPRFYDNKPNVKCYWEITGYGVRVLALEYKRTKKDKYKELAIKMADTIAKNLDEGKLPTMNYYESGAEIEEFEDLSVIFDHAQVQMGLLELARVLQAESNKEYMKYYKAGREIADFIYRTYKSNSNKLPLMWSRKESAPRGVSPNTKSIIGMEYLYKQSLTDKYKKIAEDELNRLISSSPRPGKDYHGQSYFAYGLIRGFEWFHNSKYLKKAEEFAATVSEDMNAQGKLQNIQYSRIPAQSQIIRNNVLLWKYTGKEKFLNWADLSVDYLTNQADPWTYRQDVLKLGRFYRESGGQYNYSETPELTSWGTEFHIDAMYHYLHHRYGDIYINKDTKQVASIVTKPRVEFKDSKIQITVQGVERPIKIYIKGAKIIKSATLGKARQCLIDANNIIVPGYSDKKTITINFKPLVNS